MPKTVNAVQDVDLASFGDKVKMVVKGQTVTVSGPRGTLKRDFSHLKLEFKKTGAQSCRMTKWWSTNLEKAALRTTASHITNMAIGVTSGFRYKMRTVYAHFPINCIVKENGTRVEIRNFLGEKVNREVDMLPGVVISNSPKQKDEFWFEGNDVENVSRSCALVHQKAFVRNKDIRKFLDGVYVSAKTEIYKDNELLGIENK
jgi:large subunit ribosomal protein L9e